MSHKHTWTQIDPIHRRFRCTGCNAVGHYTNRHFGPMANRNTEATIVAYRCQYEVNGRSHCGNDATHVGGRRDENRCDLHVKEPGKASTATYTPQPEVAEAIRRALGRCSELTLAEVLRRVRDDYGSIGERVVQRSLAAMVRNGELVKDGWSTPHVYSAARRVA